jgi:hypothetical protein
MAARIFTRVATVHPATVTTHAGEIRTGQLRDVALGGFFITGLFLPLASRVAWEIELSACAHIRGEGVVTRNSRDGIAIALDALADYESASHLRNLVLYNTRTRKETNQVVGEISRFSGPKIVDLRAPPPT